MVKEIGTLKIVFQKRQYYCGKSMGSTLLLVAIFITIVVFFMSCQRNSNLTNVLEFAGENRHELEKVLEHYRTLGDEQKLKAAEFLISNMGCSAFSFEGDILSHYDIIFHLYDSIRKEGIFVGEPPVLISTWDSLVNQYGSPELSKLQVKHDSRQLKAALLVNNIDAAFEAWQHSPLYHGDFELFCQTILPYRVMYEPVEDYRRRYYLELKHLLDTVTSPEGIIDVFYQEFNANRHYKPSSILWDYPAYIPVSKMEIGRRGACRHMTTYQALVMRACGLPVSVDWVVWANRSQGHSWNVLHLDSGKIFPFDAFSRKRLVFSYKPAKIFRKVFAGNNIPPEELPDITDVPEFLLPQNEIDVTSEYENAFSIEIPIQYQSPKKKFGVICVFDNRSWRIVHWGPVRNRKMCFTDMCADVLYLAAFYEKGKIIPASDPFLLLSDGRIQFCQADTMHKQVMKLERKYPRFKRIEDLAWGLRRANIEAANNPGFIDCDRFFSIHNIPFQVTDFSVENKKKFRYIRLNTATHREGNLAEIEFYGKKTPSEEETKLHGKIIGYPVDEKETPHPYTHAMDGDLETWFQKEKHTNGWVGLDLGKGNEHMITRVRLCPRSDTNFILIGDTYELFYWKQDAWESMGQQVAFDFVLTYENVPSQALYLLRNLSRGKEERIFTYEDGRQVWW